MSTKHRHLVEQWSAGTTPISKLAIPIGVAAVVGAAVLVGAALAQSPDPLATTQEARVRQPAPQFESGRPALAPRPRVPAVEQPGAPTLAGGAPFELPQIPGGGGGPMMLRVDLRERQKTHSAMRKLQDAETDEDKAAAEKELREALEEEYETHMEQFENHLAQLEEKLAELKGEIDKRREAKNELVELRLQVLINQANGLGWPGGEGPGLLGQPPRTGPSPLAPETPRALPSRSRFPAPGDRQPSPPPGPTVPPRSGAR